MRLALRAASLTSLPSHSSTKYDQVHFTSYDRQGNLLTKTDGVGQVVTYGYGDDAGLMVSVSNTGASSQNIGITYDDYDRVTGVTDAEGSILSGKGRSQQHTICGVG